MTGLDAIAAYLGVQITVAAGGVIALALGRSGLPSRGVMWTARGLLLAALIFPLVVPLLPRGATLSPPVQVWSEVGVPGGVVVAVGPASGIANVVPPVQTPGILLGVLAAGVLAACLFALRAYSLLRSVVGRAVPWRRIGRVELRVSAEATAPFAAWLPGRLIVVLDTATFTDRRDRFLAMRHELQHHRQGDTVFAYVLMAARALCPFNPLVHTWSRALRETEELACDAALILGGRISAHEYGSCLVRVSRQSVQTPALASGLTPRASRSLLKRRIDMLSCPPRVRWFTLVPAAALSACLLFATAWATDDLVADLRVDPQRVAEAARSATTPDFPVTTDEAVLNALDRYYAGTSKGRRFVRRGLVGMAEHQAMVEDALQRYGLPAQLAAVPLVESDYRNLPAAEAESSAPGGMVGAGLWMFIPQTAREYGMRVDAEHDDRLDEVVETDAAMRLLSDLHDEFGSWPLALAGYNQGARRVRDAVAQHGTDDVWELMRLGALNDYAARVMAVAILIDDPSIVGFDGGE